MKLLRRILTKASTNASQPEEELEALANLPRCECDVTNLTADAPALGNWPEWDEVERRAPFGRDRGAAVNSGDRRAIYHLVRALEPSSVLEIGTHLGGSTLMLALALSHSTRGRLTTVDILDVNGARGPYVRHGGPSPRQLLRDAGCESLTTFVTSPSVAFLATCRDRFDLIFLDGLHAASNVYQEIPLALKLLNRGGLILLHDFFPDMQPLWSNGIVVPGPFLAVERLRREGVPVVAMPLGALPWPTKLGSNITSLACLLRAREEERSSAAR